MDGLKLWAIFTVSVYTIGIVSVFYIFGQRKRCPISHQLSEAVFLNFSILLFVPITFSVFTETSVVRYAGFCFGMFLLFTLSRYYVSMTVVPPSPKYLWNAEKVLWKYISRKASR